MQRCLRRGQAYVRNETGIARNAVSVAYAAVCLARQIFGDLDRAACAVDRLGQDDRSWSPRHLVTRRRERGDRHQPHLQQRAVLLGPALRRPSCALAGRRARRDSNEVDIVVSCTASPTTILSRDQVAAASRKRRGEPLFLIDIAVPRDVEPSVNELDNVYLYDIDGLESVVDSSLKERRRAAEEAGHRIDREVEGFDRWRQSLEIKPTIVSLREALLGVAEREVERFRRRLGPMSDEQHRVVEEMARALVQKILHRPVVHLRQAVERGDVDATTALCRKLFGLDDLVPEEGARGEQSNEGRPAAEADQPRGPRRVLDGGKD